MAKILAVSAPGALPRRWDRALRGPHRLVGTTDDPDEALRLLSEQRPGLVLPRPAPPPPRRRLATAGGGLGVRGAVTAPAPELDDDERAAVLDAGGTGYV